jgi:hypothetical protein
MLARTGQSMGDAAEWVDGYRRFWEQPFERLADHLEEWKRPAHA